MKVIIDIPEREYKVICENNYVAVCACPNLLSNAIKNGTPIPDHATVGEVFCMLACKEPICETASYFTIDKELWNAPYQKGGKE